MKKILLICSTCLMAAVISCSRKSNNPDTLITDSYGDSFIATVQTIVAEEGAGNTELLLTGSVEYDPEKVVGFVPVFSGAVSKAYFTLGDRVSRGQKMLDIRSSELNALYAELSSLEAAVKSTEREVAMVQSMFDDRMATESELLAARSALTEAEASLERVKQDIGLFGTRNSDGTYTITAPTSGFVVEKNASTGSHFASESEPLFVVADLSTVWIVANIYAGDLQSVREGQQVSITSLSYPGEEFEGKINVLSQVFDPEEKVLKARIIMPNNDLRFKPDMPVNIRLALAGDSQSVIVPSEVLIFDDDRYFVIIEKSEGEFEVREVTLRNQHNGKSYISAGIAAGERIVAQNHLLIYSGLKE